MKTVSRLLTSTASTALLVGSLLLPFAVTSGTLASPVTANPAGPVKHQHADASVVDIVRLPTDLPGPLAKRGPQRLKVNLETTEVTGRLADGATYHYWTYNKKVPGPFVRARVGDTIEVTLTNDADSMMMHNVDLHAVTGPGGGGVATLAEPGQSKSFTFKALNPGLYVYHCAVPMAASHIANGMYGMILIEPEGGLPAVDREFYVMQGEIYTEEAFGTQGELTESYEKLIAETPEYYVFNGAAEALTGDRALRASVGETVRVFFGVGGPNKTSSFHVIGEIFDRAYSLASLTGTPLTDVQTLTVPPGGASVVDIKFEVPGDYMLVDHALSRVARGLIGQIAVDGPSDPVVFKDHAGPMQVSEMPLKH